MILHRPLHASSALLLILPVMACAGELAEPGSAVPEPLLTRIEYHHEGARGEFDEDGRRLTWIAAVEGDLTGEGRWYFTEPTPIPDVDLEQSGVAYYEARWEIRVDDRMVLEGRSTGKTVRLSAQSDLAGVPFPPAVHAEAANTAIVIDRILDMSYSLEATDSPGIRVGSSWVVTAPRNWRGI